MRRRGVALAMVAALLGVVALAVSGAVVAGAEDSLQTRLRAESLRAFYAAESGAMASVWSLGEGEALVGTLVYPLGESVEIVSPFEDEGEPGSTTLEGVAGEARRRITIEVE